jgi:PAS domain S-box-containing protein
MGKGQNAAPRILVVDDVPDTLKLLTNWLEVHGYQTIEASNGFQALQLASEQHPDLILLDVMMPQIDGIETCRRLKTQPQTASIPVILVTAKDPGDARADGIIAGAVDYITKPVNLQDLLARVEAVFAGEKNPQIDVQRLLEEVCHTAMAMLDSVLVWLLALDHDRNRMVSEMLITTSGSREEADFLLAASNGHDTPQFSLEDTGNPLVETLITRQITTNLPTRSLNNTDTTRPIFEAAERMHIQYFTIVPLIAAGRTTGVMVLGYYQPHDMETPRAHQILSAFGSQAATALDYSRLMADLHRREEEAQQERAFRQMILDTMSDGLVVIDARGRIKFTNRRLLRLTGYPAGYLEGRQVGDLFHPEDRDEVVRGLLSEHATTMKFDQRLITLTGKVIPVLIARSRTSTSGLDNQVIVLSDMTEQKQREYELERQTAHITALYQAAQAMTSNLALHEVLAQILNSATEVVEAQGASLFLVNRETDSELIVVAAVGYRADELIGLRVPLGEGLAGWVAREAQSQLVINSAEDPRFYRAVDQQTGMNTQSLIAVPLVDGDQVIGVLEVVNKLNDGIFDEDDMRLLEGMGGTAAVSIVNARLYDQAQRRVAELATLLDASEAASSTLDLSSVLEHIVRSLNQNLEVARSMIMAWNGPKKQLVPLAEVSNTYWLNTPQRELTAGTLAHTALQIGQPQITTVRDVRIHPVDRSHLDSIGMSGAMVVPILRQHSVIGFGSLMSISSSAFSEKDAHAVQILIQKWMAGVSEGTPIASVERQLLAELADRLLELPGVAWAAVHDWTSGDPFSRLVYEMGFVEWTQRASPNLSIAQYPTFQRVIESRLHLRMSLSALDEDTAEYQWLAGRGGQSALLVPLLLHGVAIGMVILTDITDRIFDNEEIRLAQGIANVVSNAMENARLYQSLESRAKALESAYSELQDADRAKDQFIQNISHELRTPLIHVLGYAELLRDGAFGDINDEQREALRSIAEKGQKVADIVEDMVAAQTQDSQTFDRQSIDLITVIQQALDRNRERLLAADMNLITHFPSMIPPVMADARAITEAFEKLFDNALKFGADGEQIEVIIRDTEGPVVQVAIRDYGIGVPQSEQNKIFQRFYQVDGSATRRFGGSGLGLAVAKAIIEGHGGKIGVRSKPGEGSVFYFNLPKVNLQHKKSTGFLVEQEP